MKSALVIWPGFEYLGNELSAQLDLPVLATTIRQFPDGESYVRIEGDLTGSQVLIIGSLNDPNPKALPLMFLVNKLRALGAQRIVLATPYLPYMRQDKEFNPGEYISSAGFANWMSQLVDCIVTIDPHLHRYRSLNDIYTVHTECISASRLVAEWIGANVKNPILLGPDAESKQWVRSIAEYAGIPYKVFNKKRLSDREVVLKAADLQGFENNSPVLVDDIISTAGTMRSAVKLLAQQFVLPAVCVGIHGIFSGDAYQQLLASGVGQIATCNTIPHCTNRIDISPLLVQALKNLV